MMGEDPTSPLKRFENSPRPIEAKAKIGICDIPSSRRERPSGSNEKPILCAVAAIDAFLRLSLIKVQITTTAVNATTAPKTIRMEWISWVLIASGWLEFPYSPKDGALGASSFHLRQQ
jgi:hypothetical protein